MDKEKIIGASKMQDKPRKGLIFKLKEGALSADVLAPESITGEKIAPNTITGDKIANGAITLDKLSFDVTNSILSLVVKDINSIWKKIGEITGESFSDITFEVTPKYFISEEPIPVYISAMSGDYAALFDHIAFYVNGLKVYEGVGVDSVSFETEISNTSEIKYVASILGKEYTGAETVVHYNSYWLGAGNSYSEVMTNDHLIPVTTGLRGNYDITFEKGDQLFIILGKSLRDMFIRADMNGIEIPLVEEEITIDGKQYSVLKSESAYMAGVYNIDING